MPELVILRKSFSERAPLPIGIVVSIVLVVLLVAALDIKNLPFVNSSRSYSAIFSETGGLSSGDTVQVAGIDVGTVGSTTLVNDHVKISFSISDDSVRLGSQTRASIGVLTLLGKHGLVLTSAGRGTLNQGATIPESRTDPPYDITDALSQLSTTTGDIDTGAFTKALETVSATLKKTPKSLGTTVRAVQKVSSAISSRDAQIASLFAASRNVSGILDERTAQVTTLLTDGTSLLSVINARRAAVSTLLASATALAKQLSGLVTDNQKDFGAAVTELNDAVALLNKNQSYLDTSLSKIGNFTTELGDIVGSVPGFQFYVSNLTRILNLGGVVGS